MLPTEEQLPTFTTQMFTEKYTFFSLKLFKIERAAASTLDVHGIAQLKGVLKDGALPEGNKAFNFKN